MNAPRKPAAKFNLFASSAETPRMSHETCTMIKWIQNTFSTEWNRQAKATSLAASKNAAAAAAGAAYIKGVRL